MDKLSQLLKELDARDQREDEKDYALNLLKIKGMQFNRKPNTKTK